MATETIPPTRTVLQRSELILSASLLGLLIVFLVPLPTFVLDILLSLNLTATILVLLVTLTVRQPLDFSTFPSLLLLLTLFRLALNVATTRLILLNGDAGEIVQAFGQFVVGGNLIVGMVIFFILIIIQFIVITKGAGRVSEVAARFTLDAMPGKQLAIDAEMNAGLIDEAEARKRRTALMREAEFYGTMDGASRFVRGDAIAAIIITGVNLVGGIAIGISKGLSAGAAVKTYSILTIGEGLLAQIPALITATAAGILVTKASSGTSLGAEIGGQFRKSGAAMRLGSFVMLGLALMPGLPKLPFFALAGALFFLSRRTTKPEPAAEDAKPAAATAADAAAQAPPRSPMEGYLDDFLQNDRLGLEIGNDLIPLVSTRRGPSLLDRIGTLRREVAKTSGLWVPTVRVRDNRDLESQAYRVLIGGREVAKGQIRPDLWLAIDPAGGTVQIEGEDAREPAFGLPARWIPEADKQRAMMAGYTVVDAPSVLITHLGEVARRHAHELLSRDDLKEVIDRVRTTSGPLVDDLLNPLGGLSMGALHRVFTLLLEERVPVTNITRILESLSANVAMTKDPSELAERVRADLGRAICERFRDPTGRLRAVIFDPRVEMELRRNVQNNKLNMDAGQQEALVLRLVTELRTASQRGYEIALLCDTSMRRAVRYVLSRALGDLAVLAYQELPSDVLVEPVAFLRPEDLQGGPGTVAKMFG